MSTIVLIGFRGSGKTTLGHWLADERGVAFIDTDHEVLKHLKCTGVRDAWEAVGEAGWREAEGKIIPPLLTKDAVIALGGGAPFVKKVKAAVMQARIVLNLTASPEATAGRINADDDRPPLPSADLETRLQRLQGYAELETHGIDTSGDIEETKTAIRQYLSNL
jgi:shikimate kinase